MLLDNPESNRYLGKPRNFIASLIRRFLNYLIYWFVKHDNNV